ncbi:hypothetical protein ACFW53_20500 [Nocardiopsis dassonvillei]|uniref:hypothetical protein n=1 Tax=Nocardiopsis dassonvillei TaxID=2014 RepID=UPI003672F2FB
MAKEPWEAPRDRLATLFDDESASITRALDTSREDVLQNQNLAPVVEDEWRGRLTRHLVTHPKSVAELRELLNEIAPEAVQATVTNQITGDVHGTTVQASTFNGGINTSYHGGTHHHGGPSTRINAQTEAELVQVVCSFNSGIGLSITNNGSRPVRKVELVHMARADAPGESWKLNPNVWGARSRWDLLRAGEKRRTLIWLLDAQGRQISNRNEIEAVVYTVRFLDYEGQWWERTPSGARQVPPPA